MSVQSTDSQSHAPLLDHLDTIVSHLASTRYTDNGNELYLQAAGARKDMVEALAAGKELPVIHEDLLGIEEQVAALQQFERQAGLPSLENRLNLTAKTLLGAQGNLFGDAAHDAAKHLLISWKEALADGRSLAELVPDVDQVVELLQDFKQAVAALDVSAPGLGSERQDAANHVYLNYDFPGTVTRSGEAWLIPTPNEWNLYVQAMTEDSAEEPRQLLMRVVFAPDSAEVIEAYAVDRTTGLRLDAVTPEELALAPVEVVPTSDSNLEPLRDLLADNVYQSYDFGCMVTDSGAWDRTAPEDWTRIVYAEPGQDEEGEEPLRLSFHVRFKPGTAQLEEAYALDLRTGEHIGCMPFLSSEPVVELADSALSIPDLDALQLPSQPAASDAEMVEFDISDYDDLLDIPGLPGGNPQPIEKHDVSEFDDLLPPIL